MVVSVTVWHTAHIVVTNDTAGCIVQSLYMCVSY